MVSVGTAGDCRFRESRHLMMQRAGKPQDRQSKGRARSFAKPEIEVEQRLRLERLENEPVSLLGRLVREDQIGTAGGIEARGDKCRDRNDKAVKQDRNALLRRSDHGAADRGNLESADGAEDL